MKRLLTYLLLAIGFCFVFNQKLSANSYTAIVVDKVTYKQYRAGSWSQSSAKSDAMRICKQYAKKSSDCMYKKEFDKYFEKLINSKSKKNPKKTQETDMVVEWIDQSKIKKKSTIYNWYAIAKHPQIDYEFIATKVSTLEDAKRIALNKCYDIEKKQFGSSINTKCYVDIVFDGNFNEMLATKTINKQKNQKNLINKKDQPKIAKAFDNNYIFCVIVNSATDKVVNVYKQKKITNCQKDYHLKIYSHDNYLFRLLDYHHRKAKYLKLGPDQLFTLYFYRENSPTSVFQKEIINRKFAKKDLPKKDEYDFKCEWKSYNRIIPIKFNKSSDKLYYNNILQNIVVMNETAALFDAETSYIKRILNYKTGKLYQITGSGVTFNKNYLKNKLNNLEENELIADCIDKNIDTLIAKKEKTIQPKKKVKEEFKPESVDIDNDAPIIEIAQNITVNDTSYVIEGKVSDKSDKIFVEIDGQPIEVKKGKFKVKRYSPVDEQVRIVAIDQWGNKSKPKIVNIKIKIEETVLAENLEPLNPSNIRTKSSNDKIAIIIGIENYSEAPKANYANLDAQYFFDYARKAFGVKKQNINLLINEDATVVKTDKALSLWLKSKIKKNRSDLIIFFAGHGLASADGKELYLLPQDGNPDRLERTALSRTDLFREIIELNPKSVTMFLDTCYSGVSRDEQMLLASARPIRIVADEQEGIPDNFTIFSASKLDQISSGLKEVNHGIFSYFLMKGLEGNADSNQDKKITNGELLAYMDDNVSQKAAEQGREQNPSLAGDPNKVLINYR
ncbi:caspase family protein [Candidatus Pelagibacter sp.]|nr:caspase family protein [Candidatus Pelagibacter sp.]